jgi:hypothetical protein
MLVTLEWLIPKFGLMATVVWQLGVKKAHSSF